MHTGIGFAIPINLAREVADEIIADGKFTRPWLGVGIASLRDYRYRDLVKGVADGVVVTGILENGPVAHSDLRMNDVITSIDGKSVITAQELKDAIRSKKVGQNVTLELYRQDTGKKMKVIVKPGEWVEPVQVAANDTEALPSDNALGLRVKALTSSEAKKFGVTRTGGVIVVHVNHHGLAADKGIQVNDIITSIDKQPVANMTQFLQALHNADTAKGVVIRFISDGAAKTETLKEKDE
jgi:serine protease Do